MQRGPWMWMISSLVVLAGAGCTTPGQPPRPVARADLVPLNRVGSQGPGPLCNLERGSALPRLIVSVKNQGSGGAPNSVTTVTFSPGGSSQLPTPPIPPGGAVDLPPISVPVTCFNPNCEFTIIADSTNVVNESGPRNNSAVGRCNR